MTHLHDEANSANQAVNVNLPSDLDAPDVTLGDIGRMTFPELEALAERDDLSLRQRHAIGSAAFSAKFPENIMSSHEFLRYLQGLGLTATQEDNEPTMLLPIITDDTLQPAT
jgi:hypothetical protein